MTRVYHPTLRSVWYEVPDADASKWVEQGWRYTEPGGAEAIEGIPGPEAVDFTGEERVIPNPPRRKSKG